MLDLHAFRPRAIARFAPARPSRDRDAFGGATPIVGRDVRIDLIRGLCLWMIFVDHLPDNALSHVTYGQFALADALDVFVFLSGISCALLYGRLILAAGFVRAEARALHRVAQLWVANVFIGIVNVACYFGFRGVLGGDYIAINDLTLLATEPVRAVIAMLALLYTPQMMDILPLYMLLVAAAPAILLVLMRSKAAALALSAGLWLAAANLPQLTLPSLDASGAVSFNPLSWQFLFCIGLWAGKRHYIDGVAFRPSRWLLALCWLLIAGGFIARHAGWFADIDAVVLGWPTGAEIRINLHPARLANLLATAYVTASCLGAASPWLRSRWTSPLLLSGRHSLEVFCTGAVVSITGGAVVSAYGAGFAIETALTLAGFAAMTAVAWLRDGRRSKPRASAAIEPESRPAQEVGSQA